MLPNINVYISKFITPPDIPPFNIDPFPYLSEAVIGVSDGVDSPADLSIQGVLVCGLIPEAVSSQERHVLKVMASLFHHLVQAFGDADEVSPAVVAAGGSCSAVAFSVIAVRRDLFEQPIVLVVEITGDGSSRVRPVHDPVLQVILIRDLQVFFLRCFFRAGPVYRYAQDISASLFFPLLRGIVVGQVAHPVVEPAAFIPFPVDPHGDEVPGVVAHLHGAVGVFHGHPAPHDVVALIGLLALRREDAGGMGAVPVILLERDIAKGIADGGAPAFFIAGIMRLPVLAVCDLFFPAQQVVVRVILEKGLSSLAVPVADKVVGFVINVVCFVSVRRGLPDQAAVCIVLPFRHGAGAAGLPGAQVIFRIFVRGTGPVFIEDPVRKQGLVVFIDFGSAVLAVGDGVPAVFVVVGEVLTDAVFKFLSDDPAPAVVSVFLVNILIHILFQSNINKTFWRHINSEIWI